MEFLDQIMYRRVFSSPICDEFEFLKIYYYLGTLFFYFFEKFKEHIKQKVRDALPLHWQITNKRSILHRDIFCSKISIQHLPQKTA